MLWNLRWLLFADPQWGLQFHMVVMSYCHLPPSLQLHIHERKGFSLGRVMFANGAQASSITHVLNSKPMHVSAYFCYLVLA